MEKKVLEYFVDGEMLAKEGKGAFDFAVGKLQAFLAKEELPVLGTNEAVRISITVEPRKVEPLEGKPYKKAE